MRQESLSDAGGGVKRALPMEVLTQGCGSITARPTQLERPSVLGDLTLWVSVDDHRHDIEAILIPAEKQRHFVVI